MNFPARYSGIYLKCDSCNGSARLFKDRRCISKAIRPILVGSMATSINPGSPSAASREDVKETNTTSEAEEFYSSSNSEAEHESPDTSSPNLGLSQSSGQRNYNDSTQNMKPPTKLTARDPSRPKRPKARRACLACQRAHLTCGA